MRMGQGGQLDNQDGNGGELDNQCGKGGTTGKWQGVARPTLRSDCEESN